jgi:response regulator RpfG family c-di-GMP phosphodiesterase/serine/threonine protein kinase
MMHTQHSHTKPSGAAPQGPLPAALTRLLDERPGPRRSGPRPIGLPASARAFLDRPLKLQLIADKAADRFLEQAAGHLAEYTTPELLGGALIQAGLLTSYQLDRVLAGTTHGLVLGNYRVLERLGVGGMGIVFLAEHLLMKRRVAVKVLPVDEDCPPALLERFFSEMRLLADLHHPNIVMAYDAGHVPGGGDTLPTLLYLVTELVTGGDLEQYVLNNGPVEIAQACDWIRQAACGLQEAHDRHIIHRDIKPSNLLRTEQGQVKLVDFGLVRQFCSRLTDPRALLGTLEYMAPEQSCDPSLVSGQADIYSLGATLFALLTAELPHPAVRSVAQASKSLQTDAPRRVRTLRPDVPAELEVLIHRMLDRNPDQRPSMPLTIMNALLPFTGRAPAHLPLSETASLSALNRDGVNSLNRRAGPWGSEPRILSPKRVLLVDDEESIRQVARAVLEPLGCVCDDVEDATNALAAFEQNNYDLVLLDLNLPDLDGYEICRRMRQRPVHANCKIIVVSGRGDHNELAQVLPLGADDYIPKPFGLKQLEARVQHALCLKDAQDQADFLARELVFTNRQLENSLAARTSDVRRAQDALLFAMAKMAESRDGETAGHLLRLQRYTHVLAEYAADQPAWAGVVNSTFLTQLERCVPLHDIGKIGLPDHILLKPGKLTEEERRLMETHTTIGDRMLEALGKEHGESLAFLGTASAIVRHHHERFDGSGYPDRLPGDAIPAAARLVALADVYDALRRRRFHKLALSHPEAVRILLEGSPGYFDPIVLQAFKVRQSDFERIYRDIRT